MKVGCYFILTISGFVKMTLTILKPGSHYSHCIMKSLFNIADKKIIVWLKRLGIVGFLFFLLKGIAWLALGFYLFAS